MASGRLDIEAIFFAARELALPDRAGYLDLACGADAELRQRVEQFLDAQADIGSFLESPAAAPLIATVDDPISERPGTVIGPYKLLEQIGEGGFGIVFMAEQQHPVRRKVALKVLKPGMDTRHVVARFEAERQALAIMDHVNIARVFDGGATSSGRPYFVMELVKGVPITDFCDQNQLTPRERLELFLAVCQAIQHAHQKGIIHRDLKPSNVLVSRHDSTPVVKVIDFGVAKALGQELTDKTLFTGVAQMVGTPLYMSPEQAGMSDLDVDTRSDIYALGVLLYELLTGTTPFDKDRLKEVNFDELRRIIREEEPPKPSTRISTLGQGASTISTQRKSDPKRLSQLCRGDLDWIVMKCLEKDRNRRYETASALTADVQRYLHDEPVLACPPSAAYRLRKFARRHKAGLWTAAAVSLLLVLAAGGVGWALWDAAARSATTERAVGVALVKAEHLAGQARQMPSATSWQAEAVLVVWRQADDALAQAEAALSTGTADDDVHQRVEAVRTQLADERQRTEQKRTRALRKERLFTKLDEARMTSTQWLDNSFHHAGAVEKYVAAFAEYDLDVATGRTVELARRIAGEEAAVRNALLVALDDWAESAATAKTGPSAADLRALAQAVDTDAWRKRYRAAVIARDGPALRDLGAEARRLALPASSLSLLAEHLRREGERDEALALLRWARGRHPADFWVHYNLGALLLDVEVFTEEKARTPVEVEEAIGCYRAALAVRPDSSAAHNGLGIALTDKKELVEAIAEFRRAIAIDPNLAEAHNNLGNRLFEKKELKEAMVEYRKAIAINSKLANPHSNLGHVLCEKKLWAAAIAEYRAAIALRPKRADFHYFLGITLHDNGQLNEAITELGKAVALDPKKAGWHYELGVVLEEAKNRLGEAIGEYRQAIHLDRKNAHFHNALGNALKANNQLGEAIAAYRQAIYLCRNNAIFHNNLGAALGAKHQWDEGIAELRKAIAIDGKAVEAHYNLGVALRDKGAFLRDKGLLKDAVESFRTAIKLKGDHVMSHALLADVLGELGQVDEAMAAEAEALKLWRKLAEGAPNDARYQSNIGVSLNNLARGLLARKNPAEAARMLEEAVTRQQAARKIESGNETYRLFLRNHCWNLAEALVQLGKHADAAKAAAELPGLYPKAWQEYVRAATYLSRCAALAAKDDKLGQEKRKEVVNRYGEKAVTLLRQGADKGWKNVTALKDPVFEPLRSRDDFQKLLVELERKSKQ